MSCDLRAYVETIRSWRSRLDYISRLSKRRAIEVKMEYFNPYCCKVKSNDVLRHFVSFSNASGLR